MLDGTGDAHPHIMSPKGAGSGRCSRTSPLADVHQLGCWMSPAGEVHTDVPAAVHWPDGPFVSHSTTQLSHQNLHKPI